MAGVSDQDRVVALAGLFQAAHLVAGAARQGLVDAGTLAATLGSVFVTDYAQVAEVFGGEARLADGLRVLQEQLAGRAGGRDLEVTRYVVGILHLEGRVRRTPKALAGIREGTEALRALAFAEGVTDPRVIAGLAEVYVRSVSPLGPRIIVRGEPAQLARPGNAERIRALLLAGIRAAVLWRWCGGSRLGILLGRRRIIATARALSEGRGTGPTPGLRPE